MSSKKIKVSIFCSIFKGAKYIDHYLKDITNQTIFEECELILVDANSPDKEFSKIKDYQNKYSNIKYLRLNSDPGLYACWNIAIQESSGEILNNANLDDSKRKDALEIQYQYLDENKDIDLVYADSLITNSINCSYDVAFKESAFRYNFPDFSMANIIDCNPPHQSPVYRKSLHDKFGFFDESYRSAADHEFWLRCGANGAKMKKIDDILGVYYDNPTGVSTDPNNYSWKMIEEKKVRDKYKEHGITHTGNARRIIRNINNIINV